MEDMQNYKIQLENYYGPLDLLLHLVKESELDIYNIPIARVTEQYVTCIGMMEKMDINLAGEFLVMAATLMLIKSRTLLPSDLPPDEEEEADPRMELIKKLLEYKQFKDRARMLGAMMERHSLLYSRPSSILNKVIKESVLQEKEELPTIKLNSWELCAGFGKIMKETGFEVPQTSILYNDVPLDRIMQTILKRLADIDSVMFSSLLENWEDKSKIIVNFLATLELAKQRQICIAQEANFADIRIMRPDSNAHLESMASAVKAEEEPRPAPLPEESATDDPPAPIQEPAQTEPIQTAPSEEPALPPEAVEEPIMGHDDLSDRSDQSDCPS